MQPLLEPQDPAEALILVRRYLQASYRIAEAALGTQEPADLYAQVHAIVRDLMPAENLYFALWDKPSDTVSFPYWVDAMESSPSPRKLRRGLTEYVLRTRQPLLLDNTLLANLEAAGEVEPIGAATLNWLGVPLTGSQGVFGALVIQIYAGGRRYTSEERDLLVFVSGQVAMAIERQRADARHRMMARAIDQTRDSVYGLDGRGRIIFVNESACRELGYAREELLGLSLADVDSQFPAEQWPLFMANLREQGTLFVETEHRRKDGTTLPVEISVCHLTHEGQELAFGYARDISERKQAEQALRVAERRLRTVLANSQAIIYQLDAEGRFTLSEGLGLAKLGLMPGEVVGQSALKVYAEDAVVVEQIRLALKGQASRRTTRVGSRLYDNFQTPVLDEQGRLESIIGIATDITERHRAEEALLAERGLFVGGPVMVFKWRAQPGWPVEYVSPNVATILGHAPADFINGSLSYEQLIHPEDLARIRQETQGHMERGRFQFEQQYRLRNSQGSYRWFYDFTAAAAPGPKPSHFLGYLLDITDQRESEDSRRQTQKLESLGVLAGGIAHDFNNLLTVVLGNLNLAQIHLEETSPALPYLTNMETSVLRATELTKQMLAYSGRGHFVVRPHNLNAVVRDLTHLLEVSISKKVRLQFDLDPDLPTVQADVAQLQQVVMNLVTNASDAIGDREGAIHLSTSAQPLDAHELRSIYRVEAPVPGPHVILEVEDTGCGMTSEVMERIFDPFFTTKATGRGLGLSAMLGILRGHGAGLRITSEEGRGSIFRLCFPASEEPAGFVANGLQTGPGKSLHGLVLLVDDEDQILQTTRSALTSLGFQVVCAVDGIDALERFTALGTSLSLVLMDLTMPRMDGREAFHAMREIHPEIPVVLSSGFTEQDSLQAFPGGGPAGFLQKPYQLKDLRATLQRALER